MGCEDGDSFSHPLSNFAPAVEVKQDRIKRRIPRGTVDIQLSSDLTWIFSWALVRFKPSEIREHSYRGALPDYPPSFKGIWSQVLVAQSRRTGWELFILEQCASLQALLLQGFIVLLQILDGIPVGSEPVCCCSFLAESRRDPGHAAHPPAPAAALPLPPGPGEEVNMGRQQARVEPRTAPGAPAALEGGGTRRANMYRGTGGSHSHATKAGIVGTACCCSHGVRSFCCPFLKYSFSQKPGRIFLQAHLLTDGKRLCVFRVLKVRF